MTHQGEWRGEHNRCRTSGWWCTTGNIYVPEIRTLIRRHDSEEGPCMQPHLFIAFYPGVVSVEKIVKKRKHERFGFDADCGLRAGPCPRPCVHHCCISCDELLILMNSAHAWFLKENPKQASFSFAFRRVLLCLANTGALM